MCMCVCVCVSVCVCVCVVVASESPSIETPPLGSLQYVLVIRSRISIYTVYLSGISIRYPVSTRQIYPVSDSLYYQEYQKKLNRAE